MNPYQQPQNNAPYGQSPGYPQQAGPNKYPTLPPVQNPQYPPQQPQYPGYNAQARPAGYQPPAQYGNVQGESNHNEEREAVVKQIADLEQGFNTCFMNFYKVWLYLLAFLCTVTFVSDFIINSRGRNLNGISDEAVMYFFLMVWNVTQAMFGLKAISQKSLKKANVACWMMTLVLIPWLILEIVLLVWAATYQQGNTRVNILGLVLLFAGIVGVVICIHVGLSMNGAFKVKKILIERGILEEKLNEIDYSFRA